ncbi:MAG: NAD-dependent epimerase/dehydratase family protein [Thermoguttaceae bacterium]|jgi:NADH dehydrogenase
MADGELHVVTGAFGFSGRYITRRLLDAGGRVRTLTNSRRPNPIGDRVEARPYNFDKPAELVESLRGATVLYNTYWVRFAYGDFGPAAAVENTLVLFRAAAEAGIRRVVHVSITNPSADSPLEYFRGKAQLEKSLLDSGLSYAILRPAVLFGKEDILINNIAWTLRKFPVFILFGDGRYRLQPIYVDDLARLAVEQGAGRDNETIQAIGPETFTYRELVQTIGRIIGRERPILGVPPLLGYLGTAAVGWLVGDVVVTRDEIRGLMGGLLAVDAPPAGTTRLTDWAAENAQRLGVRYASELARRKNRTAAYEEL